MTQLTDKRPHLNALGHGQYYQSDSIRWKVDSCVLLFSTFVYLCHLLFTCVLWLAHSSLTHNTICVSTIIPIPNLYLKCSRLSIGDGKEHEYSGFLLFWQYNIQDYNINVMVYYKRFISDNKSVIEDISEFQTVFILTLYRASIPLINSENEATCLIANISARKKPINSSMMYHSSSD